MATIDELLVAARARLTRITAPELAVELAGQQDVLIVDIRPVAQRAETGEIPGAIAIERNVLEWRLDPTSAARIDAAIDHRIRVVVVCEEGYTSSLAAASLHDLGLLNATDLIGGTRAWIDAGLAVTRASGSA